VLTSNQALQRKKEELSEHIGSQLMAAALANREL